MKRVSDDLVAWYGGGWSGPPEDVPDDLHTKSDRPKRALVPTDPDVLKRVGVILGRFRPPHLGHRSLVEQAFSQCGMLHVLVPIARGSTQARTAAFGADAAFDDYAHVQYAHPFEGDHVPRAWAERLRSIRPRPTHLFSSDASRDGAAALAEAAGMEHVLVDPQRRVHPVSSTMIRNDPENMFHWIVPEARFHYALTVEIVGVEGAGKTTLARELATIFQAPVMEDEMRRAAERARGVPSAEAWLEAMRLSHERRAVALHEADTGIVIDDTGRSLIHAWSQRLGVHIPSAGYSTDGGRDALWLVCHDDFPPGEAWTTAMGERHDPAARATFAAEVKRLASMRQPGDVVHIRGEGRDRVDVAADAIRAARSAKLARLKTYSR